MVERIFPLHESMMQITIGKGKYLVLGTIAIDGFLFESSDHESSLIYVQSANIKSRICNSLQSAYAVSSISNYVQPAYNELTTSTLALSSYTELTTSIHASQSFIESGIKSRIQPSYGESATSIQLLSFTDSVIGSPVQSSFADSATSIHLSASFSESDIRNTLQSSYAGTTTHIRVLPSFTESIISSPIQSSYAESTASIHVSPSFIESVISSPIQSSYAESSTSIHALPSFTESVKSSPIQSSYSESSTSSREWPSYTIHRDLTVFSHVQSSCIESTISSHALPSYVESIRSQLVWYTLTAESTTSSTVWSANTETAKSSFQEAVSYRKIKSTKSELHITESISTTPFQLFDSEVTNSSLHHPHRALNNTNTFWFSNTESTSLIPVQSYLMQTSSPALTSSSSVLSPNPVIDYATPALSAKHSLAITQPVRASVSRSPISTPSPAPVTNSEVPQRSAGFESAKSTILPIAGGVVGGLAAVAASAFLGVFIYKRKLKAKIHISNLEEGTIADQNAIAVQNGISREQAQDNSISEQKKV